MQSWLSSGCTLEKEMQYCVNRTDTNILVKLNPSTLGGHELWVSLHIYIFIYLSHLAFYDFENNAMFAIKQNEILKNWKMGSYWCRNYKLRACGSNKTNLNKLLVTCFCVKKNLMYTKHEDVHFWGLFEAYIIYCWDPYYIYVYIYL